MSELNPQFDLHLTDLPQYDEVLEAQATSAISLQPKDLEN